MKTHTTRKPLQKMAHQNHGGRPIDVAQALSDLRRQRQAAQVAEEKVLAGLNRQLNLVGLEVRRVRRRVHRARRAA